MNTMSKIFKITNNSVWMTISSKPTPSTREKRMYLDQYVVHYILQILIKTSKTGLS